MNSLKIFHNTWALQQLPVTLQLFTQEWKFLICSDGKSTTEQIQKRLGLSTTERDAIIKRLCDIGLLTETTLSLEDYTRSTVDRAQATAERQTFNEYVASCEKSPAPELAPTPAEKNVPAFSPLQKPSSSSPMSLQAVIQFILNHSNSDPAAGHFATYQVFMGIGTPLLKRNGITSLRFQDDRIITDPELQKAIIDSIHKVLNVTCTPELLSSPVPTGK